MAADRQRFARIALSFIAEPGDLALGALLRTCSPADVFDAICEGRAPRAAMPSGASGHASPGDGVGPADGVGPGEDVGPGDGVGPGDRASPGRGGIPGLGRAVVRWAARLSAVPTGSMLAAWERAGIRIVCPGDPEWPTQLNVLGDARPLALWLRGSADLRFGCLRSISVVGARAATGYGRHVATEMAGALAERGWAVVSGGAYGIDSCAHRGALAADGVTVAVLASGVSYGYPQGHHELFAAIAGQGVVVSEWPPDRAPSRPGFLIRNRVIAALSCGTVVVEAALRSGALSTARHARDLGRPLMAVPGPVTSSQSEGCHEIIREWNALCVTGAQDVIENVSPAGEGLASRRRGPAFPRDSLDEETTAVLEAVPASAGGGPAAIAIAAGVDLDTAIRCLGALAAAGFVERCPRGWRVRKKA